MRKHKKNRGITKSAVVSVEVKPAKTSTERKVVQNPTTGEFEVVHVVTTVPAVVKQGKAMDNTTKFGKVNTGGLGATKSSGGKK